MSKDWINTESTITFKIGSVEKPNIQVKGAPAVASTSKGRLDVFVRGMDEHPTTMCLWMAYGQKTGKILLPQIS